MLTESQVLQIEIELSTDCNAECPLCARTDLGMPLKGNNNITLQQIKKIFPSKEHVYDKEIKLCGVLGDPIVNPECLEICEYLDQFNPDKIAISTNGGYNNVEWWTKLAQLKSVVVDFAVDGHEKTNHLYRINVSWKTLKRNMDAYAQAGGRGAWIFIPFDHNDEEYDTALNNAKELGFTFKKRTSGRNELNNMSVKPRKHDKEVDIKGSNKRKHNDLTNIKKYVKAQEARSDEDIKILSDAALTIECKHRSRPEVYIAADMTLWPCCFLYDTYVKRMRKPTKKPQRSLYGDENWNSLLHHNMDEILQHPMYTNLQSMWQPTHANYLDRCLKSCGDKAAYANKNQIIL